MKTFLPWILVVAFAAGAGTLFVSNSSQKTELQNLRAQVQQLEAQAGQADDLQKQVAAKDDQIASMQKDNAELLKLRGQIRQMTDEKAAMAKDLAKAQSQAERSQAEVQTIQQRVSDNARAAAEQQILQAKQNVNAAGTCINNLRLIDGAKQQWALQNQKGPDAIPQPQDIVPFLPNGQMPMCPGGGRYTLNAVNKAPTCTIPGHTL